MSLTAIIILWTAAIFSAVILLLALKPKIVNRIIVLCGVFAALGGLAVYGYGYAYTCESTADGVVRTAFSLIRLFIGEESYGDISLAPAFQYAAMQFIFWLLHFLGIFTTVAAALSSFGAGLLRRLRLRLNRRGELSVIYGISEQTLGFGRDLSQYKKGNVIFVGGDQSDLTEEMLSGVECHLRTDADALCANVKFLKSIGLRPGTRRIHVYALAKDPFAARRFASDILSSFKRININCEQSMLTLRAAEDISETDLLANDKRYGFGSVDFLDEPQLAARLLMLRHPPYELMRFDDRGLAQNDFRCLIIGFGELGQAVLRHMIMNAQFEGSRFRAVIMDPNYENRAGRLNRECASLMEHYSITPYPYDARGNQFYSYFEKEGKSFSYIVLCTGSDDLNQEIACELRHYMDRQGSTARLCLCSRRGVGILHPNGTMQADVLYSPEILSSDKLDLRAMELNYSYNKGSTLTAKQEWARCDYFSRISSRASADFAEAIAYIAGVDPHSPPSEGWQPDKELLENLAKTEHLRWCAFHYAMGVSPMPEAVFKARSAQYLKEKAETGSSSYRISKDMSQYLHACLVDWEELDKVSQEENAVTGGKKDYKQIDRDNILTLPTLLKIKKG